MNSVVTRALSGAVYVIAIVGCIFYGKWAFCLLTVIFALIASHEYFLMAHAPYGDNKDYIAVKIVDMVFTALLPLSTMMHFFIVSYHPATFILTVYFLVRATMALNDKGEHAFREVAKSVLGVVYIGIPLMLANIMYHFGGLGKWIVLVMFILIWLNDTGAFCFGITLGKHRLCERLSPKKSWEGFWGGMFCCVLFGVIAYFYLGSGLLELIGLGIIVSIMATVGDLFESMLKRTVKVKDSGSLIPGHGGILDRIDSLLFVAPTLFLYLQILGY